MQSLLTLVTALTVVGCANAQEEPARQQWHATIKVIDESGQPVAGASATMSWYVGGPEESTTFDKVEGLTNTNGICTVSHAANGSISLGFTAGMAGYYSATKAYELAQLDADDQAKWNPAVTLLLKKCIEPVAMHAKWIREEPPVAGQPIGYDLEAGDWVAPHGKGKATDMFFAVYHDRRAENDWDYKVMVTFPNEGDGIQSFSVSDLDRTSALRSPQAAPLDGYLPEWVKTQSRRPGQPSTYGVDKELNFFFRVRTVLDEQGHVKSAHYGKVYGDFMDFVYYFNPVANSLSVEFDSKHNLLSDRAARMVRVP